MLLGKEGSVPVYFTCQLAKSFENLMSGLAIISFWLLPAMYFGFWFAGFVDPFLYEFDSLYLYGRRKER